MNTRTCGVCLRHKVLWCYRWIFHPFCSITRFPLFFVQRSGLIMYFYEPFRPFMIDGQQAAAVSGVFWLDKAGAHLKGIALKSAAFVAVYGNRG